ncbi:hypothetical protein QBC39DRAFT_146119 [Podospora conica]|nr:hypothetical protein QBC39DRAFT_146119 [Schizothecium conicum]
MLVVLKQVLRSRGCVEDRNGLGIGCGSRLRYPPNEPGLSVVGFGCEPANFRWMLCHLVLSTYSQRIRIDVRRKPHHMLRYDIDAAEAISGEHRQPRRPLTRQSDLRPRTARVISQMIVRSGRAIYSPRPRVSLPWHKASNVPQAKCHRFTTTGDEAGDSRVGPRHSCVMKTGAPCWPSGVTRPASEGDVAFRAWTDAAMSVHGLISISRQPPAGIMFAAVPCTQYRQSTETCSERVDTTLWT